MIKKIAKYTTNILAIINALILGLDPIWNIPYADKISNTIIVIIGVIGTYLLGSKGYSKIKGEWYEYIFKSFKNRTKSNNTKI